MQHTKINRTSPKHRGFSKFLAKLSTEIWFGLQTPNGLGFFTTCKKLCKERTWKNLIIIPIFQQWTSQKFKWQKGFFNHPVGQHIGSHLSSFNLPRGSTKHFLSHLRKNATFPDPISPKPSPLLSLLASRRSEINWSTQNLLREMGRSYTPRKLSRKETQHKMKVGWFRGCFPVWGDFQILHPRSLI